MLGYKFPYRKVHPSRVLECSLVLYLYYWYFPAHKQTQLSLRKHAYSNILKILPPKNENFQIKHSKFHISAQNIDCGYSLEPPRRGGSNAYPLSVFLSRNKKNNLYPFKPQFYYIKVGFKRGQNYIGMFSWCTEKDIANMRRRWYKCNNVLLAASCHQIVETHVKRVWIYTKCHCKLQISTESEKLPVNGLYVSDTTS